MSKNSISMKNSQSGLVLKEALSSFIDSSIQKSVKNEVIQDTSEDDYNSDNEYGIISNIKM